MSRLKRENLAKCVNVLGEFINGLAVSEREKGIAILALQQLKRITAGEDIQALMAHNPKCIDIPRAG